MPPKKLASKRGKEYRDDEERIQRVCQLMARDMELHPEKKRVNVKAYAVAHGVRYQKLNRRWSGGPSLLDRGASHSRLDADQQRTLVEACKEKHKAGYPFTEKTLAAAAAQILRLKLKDGEEVQPLGARWPSRFIAKHKLERIIQKHDGTMPPQVDHKAALAQAESVTAHVKALQGIESELRSKWKTYKNKCRAALCVIVRNRAKSRVPALRRTPWSASLWSVNAKELFRTYDPLPTEDCMEPLLVFRARRVISNQERIGDPCCRHETREDSDEEPLLADEVQMQLYPMKYLTGARVGLRFRGQPRAKSRATKPHHDGEQEDFDEAAITLTTPHPSQSGMDTCLSENRDGSSPFQQSSASDLSMSIDPDLIT